MLNFPTINKINNRLSKIIILTYNTLIDGIFKVKDVTNDMAFDYPTLVNYGKTTKLQIKCKTVDS